MPKKTLHFPVFFVLGAFVFLLLMNVPVYQQKGEIDVQDVSVFDLSLEELLEIEVYSVSEESKNNMDEALPIFIIFLELTFRYVCFLCFLVAVI